MVLDDLHGNGGYPAKALDRHSFRARDNKQLVLLRAAIVLAMAARMGQSTVRVEDADAFANYLASAAREIDFAAANLYQAPAAANTPCHVVGPAASAAKAVAGGGAAAADAVVNDVANLQACTGYATNFESELPLVEASLIKVVVAALPADRARAFLTAVANGDVVGAAFKALKALKSLAVGLHYANGSFRSGLEAVAIQKGCEDSASKPMTVERAVSAECLNIDTKSLFDSTDRGPLGIGAVDPTAFDALFRIANNACSGLPLLTSTQGSDEKTRRQARDAACGTLWFRPQARPVTMPSTD
ncbi:MULTISPECIES: hypothetical protein [unclassified Novosphingobium]|uniref:hypothetical protein n=1 Tax=unclassified Novosphingobium TaxID=2644732 RepID=UPI00146EEE9D|nr:MULTISPECIES: hypothetical protein [unclassified Novosphingobium]NMN05586.1 hypothetical protein [Novosphingobium sp. SG919]NMN88055.1 hypothetical protein [Novosphingobium sp. SG916]